MDGTDMIYRNPYFIRALRLNLGINEGYQPSTTIGFREDAWQTTVDRAVRHGITHLLVNVGEGCAYASHPEIAAKDALTPAKLNGLVRRIRKQGLEAVPMLNFSTMRDGWIGKYRYCRRSLPYYRMCRDVITELCEIFEKPRLFNIGMTDESYDFVAPDGFVFYRQKDIYWKDVGKYQCYLEDCGAAMWLYGDYAIGKKHEEAFNRWAPRDAYYTLRYFNDEGFGYDPQAQPQRDQRYAADVLSACRFVNGCGCWQIPCGSFRANRTREQLRTASADTLEALVEMCRRQIDKRRLKGFLLDTRLDWRDGANDGLNEFGLELMKKHTEAF